MDSELLDAEVFRRFPLHFGESFCAHNIEKGQKIKCSKIAPNEPSLVAKKKENPWEMTVNMSGIEASNISVQFENNILKVKGERKTDDGYFYVQRHQTLPDGVTVENLKANLTAEGILKIQHKENSQMVHIDVKKEKEESNNLPCQVEI